MHPGYGFLAENPKFAEVCETCKLTFIGPPPQAIHLMGDKNLARIEGGARRSEVLQGAYLTAGCYRTFLHFGVG